ncbi:MAG: nicotinate-nicotinamide nucleotide adenylyltransferase [Phycisphaerae bacterium]|nr:nicotinate-nicotinamide nucleotide adenylyltransferase [Gemmatimonadaceae bacterium]
MEAYRRLWPAAELHLLIGEDAVAGLARWRDPERLLSMVRLVVLSRTVQAGANADATDAAIDQWMPGQPIRLATRRVDVSSTEIRARVQDGQTLRGFVPDAVAAYIASTGLYLQASAALGDPLPD